MNYFKVGDLVVNIITGEIAIVLDLKRNGDLENNINDGLRLWFSSTCKTYWSSGTYWALV